MKVVVDYFETIPALHRTIIMAGGLAFFWILESTLPLYYMRYDKWHHAIVNFFFTATTIVVNFSLAFSLLWISNWTQAHQFGILPWLPPVSIVLQLVIGLLVLDFVGAYLAHWLEHQVQWLWRFHLIHHTDPYVDTTTANRHHPGESVIRFVFTTFAVLIAGAPMWLVMFYQTLSVALSQFNHANIGLPKSVDRLVSWLIVTPDMHHVHHHFCQPQTDSNYGNIFAIWDRLFGTFHSMARNKLVYGIDTYPDKRESSRLSELLRIPFRRYRSPPGSKFSKASQPEVTEHKPVESVD